jgi:hypothetical protein
MRNQPRAARIQRKQHRKITGEKHLRISLPNSYILSACAAGLALAVSATALGQAAGTGAEAPAGTAPAAQTPAPANSAPTGDFFSSLKQAFKQDLNREVVRGHFDVGAAPDTHRFYCLVDTKTGKREVYGVGGEPFVRPDGMTGIRAGAVSPDSCEKAEAQGMLVTTGYVLSPAIKSSSGAAPPPPSPPPPPPVQRPAPEVGKNVSAPEKIDVAGVKLGMTPEQVRSVLKPKLLANYYESTQVLGGFDPHSAGGRFVNEIAAWTSGEGEESYEVMFTPVPGRERAMAVVRSAAYSVPNAIGVVAMQGALVKKYGGYSGELPDSPTWRVQSDGSVLTGDPCARRSVFGGLSKVDAGVPARANLALQTTPEEFRYQIDHCGAAVVTEDQSASNAEVSAQNRVVTRFTVTAYSPVIGFDGATAAAQLMQTAGSPATRPQAKTGDKAVPEL